MSNIDIDNQINKWTYGWRENRILSKLYEKSFLYMDPIAYSKIIKKPLWDILIIHGFEKPELFLFNFLQIKMKIILETFVNNLDCGLDGRPFSDDGFERSRLDLYTLQALVQDLLNHGYSEFLPLNELFSKKFNKTISNKDVADFVSCYYSIFPKFLQKTNPLLKKIIVKNPPKLDSEKYLNKDYEYRKTIIDFKDYFLTNLSWAYKCLFLHGSLSTLDYVTNSSDLDTFGIIRKEVCSSSSSLQKLRDASKNLWNFFYKLDPLQHHGVMLATEYDMNYYPQPLFPLKILNYSKTLWSNSTDKSIFYERNSDFEQMYFLYQTIQGFRWRLFQPISSLNAMNMKFYLNLIMLLPTLFYQANGNYMYKRDSFPKIYTQYQKNFLEPITKVSEIRKNSLYITKSPKKKLQTLLSTTQLSESDLRTIAKIKKNDCPTNDLLEFLGENFNQKVNVMAEALYEDVKEKWPIRDSKQKLIKSSSSSLLNFFNYPKELKLINYQKAMENIVSIFSENIDNVEILRHGQISSPGISDVDLIIVVQDNENVSELNQLDKLMDGLDEITKYICYHSPFMINKKNFDSLSDLWPISNCTNILTNKALKQFDQLSEQHILALIEIKILTNFLIDLFKPFLKHSIDVRMILIRMHSLSHSIKKLSQFDIQKNNWNEFIEEINQLRGQWFTKSIDEQNKEIFNLLCKAVKICLELIDTLRKIISDKIKISENKNTSIFGVLDNRIFFISNWTPQICIKIIDDVFQSTNELAIPMPIEFLYILVAYEQSPILSKNLGGRLIHNIKYEKTIYHNLIFERISLFENISNSLYDIGLQKIVLPILTIDFSKNPSKKYSEKIAFSVLFNVSTDVNKNIKKFYNQIGKNKNLINEIDKLIANDKFDKVFDLSSNLINDDPHNAVGHYYMAFVLQKHKKIFPEAILHYDLALKYGHDPFWVYYFRGFCYLNLKSYKNALDDFQNAFLINPKHQKLQDIIYECKKNLNN